MGIKEFTRGLAEYNEQQLIQIDSAVNNVQLAVDEVEAIVNDLKNTDVAQLNSKIDELPVVPIVKPSSDIADLKLELLTERAGTNGPFKVKGFYVNAKGTITVEVWVKRSNTSYNCHYYWDKNGVQLEYAQNGANATIYTKVSKSIAVEAGDLIELRLYSDNVNTTVYAKDMRVYWSEVVTQTTLD